MARFVEEAFTAYLGFVSTSVVRWNSADLTTTFVSATQLDGSVPASDALAVGTARVTVGGGTSNALVLSMLPAIGGGGAGVPSATHELDSTLLFGSGLGSVAAYLRLRRRARRQP